MIKLITGIMLLTLIGCADIDPLDPGYNVAPICHEAGCGTAFAVSPRRWVTALHVVDEHDKYWLQLADGDVEVRVVQTLPARDLAVVTTHSALVEDPLDTCGSPRWGEHLCGCGFEASEILGCECGTVLSKSGKKATWVEVDTYVVSIASNPGWSGGPLLDSDGCVVGALVGGKRYWSYSYGVGLKGVQE
jgi:hypothetical protein